MIARLLFADGDSRESQFSFDDEYTASVIPNPSNGGETQMLQLTFVNRTDKHQTVLLFTKQEADDLSDDLSEFVDLQFDDKAGKESKQEG